MEKRKKSVCGFLHVYTGDGKGKTTAALGLALRAAGAGMRTYIGQFLKKGDFSEIEALKRFPEITVKQFGLGRFVRGKPTETEIRAAALGLDSIRCAMLSGYYDLVIADEANCAVACGLITIADLLSLARDRPKGVDLLITGRGTTPSLVRQADLVSVIRGKKHPFDRGVKARKGIDC